MSPGGATCACEQKKRLLLARIGPKNPDGIGRGAGRIRREFLGGREQRARQLPARAKIGRNFKRACDQLLGGLKLICSSVQFGQHVRSRNIRRINHQEIAEHRRGRVAVVAAEAHDLLQHQHVLE